MARRRTKTVKKHTPQTHTHTHTRTQTHTRAHMRQYGTVLAFQMSNSGAGLGSLEQSEAPRALGSVQNPDETIRARLKLWDNIFN